MGPRSGLSLSNLPKKQNRTLPSCTNELLIIWYIYIFVATNFNGKLYLMEFCFPLATRDLTFLVKGQRGTPKNWTFAMGMTLPEKPLRTGQSFGPGAQFFFGNWWKFKISENLGCLLRFEGWNCQIYIYLCIYIYVYIYIYIYICKCILGEDLFPERFSFKLGIPAWWS